MAELDLLTDPATMAPIPLTGPSQDPLLPPANPDHPSDLAIGLELKFLVPFLRTGFPDPAPADTRPLHSTPHADDPALLLQQAYRLVADILRAASQRTIAISEITSRHARESDFWSEHWIVKRSNSAEPSEGQKLAGYAWAPLEISSPRLPVEDSHMYELIAKVTRALETGCRFTVNFSCEVHVHIGRADGTSLSMLSLKNFAVLSWFSEPILRLLKDPRSPNFTHVYTWSSALQQHSRLATRASNLRGMGRDYFAQRQILNAQNELELGRLMSGDERRYRRLGFNFSAFGLEDERAGRSPRSVEVRFFEDYRGCEEVLGWVRVCLALGFVAVTSRLDASLGFEGLTEVSPGERMEGLLRALGVEENVVSLFKRRVEEIHSHGAA